MSGESAVVIAAIGAAISLLTALLQWRSWRSAAKASDGDAAESLSQAAINLLAPYKLELETLRTELAAVQERVSLLECENAELKAQNRELRQRVDLLERENKALRVENEKLAGKIK